MGTHTTYDDLGPGLHVLREADPLKRASVLAADLRGDLCATLPQAEAALSERSGLPLLDAAGLAALQTLARRMARAERIAARTRDRAVAQVEDRIAATGAGLAVHPTTIRDRAVAVDIARTDLAAAERALHEHSERLAAAEEKARAATAARATGAAVSADTGGTGARLGSRSHRAIGLLLVGGGVTLLLLAANVAVWAALLPVLAACLIALRFLRPEREDTDIEGRQEASSLLSQMSASTDELFGPWRAARELDEQSSLLRARHGRAEEEVRVAERAWRELAGEGVDIGEVEEVVRRYDPQHEDARLLASEAVGVRAAEAVVRQVAERWQAAWRDLGLDAPEPGAGEAAVRELADRLSRPIVLVGPATHRSADLARIAPAAPVVVLDGPTDEAVG